MKKFNESFFKSSYHVKKLAFNGMGPIRDSISYENFYILFRLFNVAIRFLNQDFIAFNRFDNFFLKLSNIHN